MRERKNTTNVNFDESNDDSRSVSSNSIYNLFRTNSKGPQITQTVAQKILEEVEENENDHLKIDLSDVSDSDLPDMEFHHERNAGSSSLKYIKHSTISKNGSFSSLQEVDHNEKSSEDIL